MTLYPFTSFLTAFSALALGIFVFAKNPQTPINRRWFVMSLSVCIWGAFLSVMFLSREPKLALTASRVLQLGAALIPITFFHFVTALLGLEHQKRLWLMVGYVTTTGIIVLGATPLIVKGVAYSSLVNCYYPVAGGAYIFYILIFFLFSGYAWYLMARVLGHAGSVQRNQIKYVMIAAMIGFLSGASTFPLWYGVKIAPFAVHFVFLYTTIISIAIIRHQLMDIEVVIKRTLVFAGLVGAVVGVVSLVAFVSQDVLARFVTVPRWLSNMLAAAIIAAVYGPLRNWLVNTTERYLFQKKYDYKELLKKFTDEVMIIVDLQQLVQMTVNTLTETVKLDGCSLLLLDKEKQTYELAAARGINPSTRPSASLGISSTDGAKRLNGQPLVLEEHEPFVTFLRETHEPIGMDGQLGKVRFPEAVTNRVKQLNAHLCLPLSLHDDLIGVLCLGKKKSDEEFTKDDLDILLPLARTLGIAVANAQLFVELAKTQAEAAQKEKLAVIGTLSAGINHEICNPLGIVKAQCEAFLLDSEDGILIGKSSQEVLERISNIMRVALKQIDRATAITQKLSNFAKPIKEPTAQPVSVEQEVDEVLLLVGHDLKLEKIAVEKSLQQDLPPIVVDRRQLQEVLFNIIRNAAQAITPPGTILIRTYEYEGQVRIAIADTGSGIPMDKLAKIYDPFFTTKEPGKGTGLGLFIVKQIVERNKGRITVESLMGKGTTFFLDFPVAAATAQPASR